MKPIASTLLTQAESNLRENKAGLAQFVRKCDWQLNFYGYISQFNNSQIAIKNRKKKQKHIRKNDGKTTTNWESP